MQNWVLFFNTFNKFGLKLFLIFREAYDDFSALSFRSAYLAEKEGMLCAVDVFFTVLYNHVVVLRMLASGVHIHEIKSRGSIGICCPF